MQAVCSVKEEKLQEIKITKLAHQKVTSSAAEKCNDDNDKANQVPIPPPPDSSSNIPIKQDVNNTEEYVKLTQQIVSCFQPSAPETSLKA